MATVYGGSDSEVTTGTVDATHRQPTVFDYSQSNQFKVFFQYFQQRSGLLFEPTFQV